MPNYVINEIIVEGDYSEVKSFVDCVGVVKDGEESVFDLATCLPIPATLVSSEATKWMAENWGVCRNSISVGRKGQNKLYFLTAIQTPDKAISLLSKKFPSLKLTTSFVDEINLIYSGYYVCKNGVIDDEGQISDKKRLELHSFADETIAYINSKADAILYVNLDEGILCNVIYNNKGEQ